MSEGTAASTSPLPMHTARVHRPPEPASRFEMVVLGLVLLLVVLVIALGAALVMRMHQLSTPQAAAMHPAVATSSR